MFIGFVGMSIGPVSYTEPAKMAFRFLPRTFCEKALQFEKILHELPADSPRSVHAAPLSFTIDKHIVALNNNSRTTANTKYSFVFISDRLSVSGAIII